MVKPQERPTDGTRTGVTPLVSSVCRENRPLETGDGKRRGSQGERGRGRPTVDQCQFPRPRGRKTELSSTDTGSVVSKHNNKL